MLTGVVTVVWREPREGGRGGVCAVPGPRVSSQFLPCVLSTFLFLERRVAKSGIGCWRRSMSRESVVGGTGGREELCTNMYA